MIEKVLVVDDEPIIRNFLYDFFTSKNLDVSLAEDGQKAIELLKREHFDFVITDMKMPRSSGMEVLKFAKKNTDAIVVIMTAFGSIENAVGAMQEGAFHYIIKPSSFDALDAIFQKAEEHLILVNENHYLKEEITFLTNKKHQKVIAHSPAMKEVFKTVQKIASTNASVFINGESGTGKEVIASCIHSYSLRSKEPFIKVNCAAVPETLIESEFFGHEKGSFTGAHTRRLGRFELANKGTILLDEVTEIPILLQPKLLRAVQEQEFERVGSEKPINVNVRIVATSNRNMVEAVQDKIFREDLYYRLNVVPIEIPPLRKRKEDIIPLAEHFLEIFSQENHKPLKRFSSAAKKKLASYSFPGNVRELGNIIERIIVLEQGREILAEHLPLNELISVKKTKSLGELEKVHILQTLRDHQSKTKAAKLLGISVRTLRNKLKLYNL